MDLFELLFIALFVLIPVFEGILKKSRRQPSSDEEEGPPQPAGGRPRGTERSPARDPRDTQDGDRQPGPASDMVPEDLWAILTGERRPSGPATMEGRDREHESRGWEVEEDEAPGYEDGWVEEVGSEEGRWSADPEPGREPLSLEYVGPEAYSLETPPPPPEVRHARFHRNLERLEVTAPKRRPPLLRALTRPTGLRDAVILAEVLGPPKGLE